MQKRSIEETTNTEFSFDNSNEQLRKIIKLQNQKIIEKVEDINEEIDINVVLFPILSRYFPFWK